MSVIYPLLCFTDFNLHSVEVVTSFCNWTEINLLDDSTCIIVLLLFGGHVYWWSKLNPSSVLRTHSWQGSAGSKWMPKGGSGWNLDLLCVSKNPPCHTIFLVPISILCVKVKIHGLILGIMTICKRKLPWLSDLFYWWWLRNKMPLSSNLSTFSWVKPRGISAVSNGETWKWRRALKSNLNAHWVLVNKFSEWNLVRDLTNVM